jgi:hypothetical protein
VLRCRNFEKKLAAASFDIVTAMVWNGGWEMALRCSVSIAAYWKGIALRIRVSLNLVPACSAGRSLALIGSSEGEMGSTPYQTHWVTAFGTSCLVVGSEIARSLLLLKGHDFT